MSMFYELMMEKKGMPSRYQEVEYIESTGTQYIDTGYIPDNDTGAKAEFYLENTDHSNYVLGSRGVGVGRFYLYNNESSSNARYGWGTLNTTTATVVTQQKISASLNFYNNKKYIFNEQYTANLTNQDFSGNTYPMYLFANDGAGSFTTTTPLKGRIYNCQITQNNRLVRNFIPVYDTLTQKYGMWESVQRKFYGNDGTGDFAGA